MKNIKLNIINLIIVPVLILVIPIIVIKTRLYWMGMFWIEVETSALLVTCMIFVFTLDFLVLYFAKIYNDHSSK